MRPKVPQRPPIETFNFTELSKMLADQQTPEETVEEIAKQSDQATGN